MVLAGILIALILLFVLLRHHVGVPFLAMIAGVAVNESFGDTFATALNMIIPAVDTWIYRIGLQLLFVAIMPLILYFRAGKTGLFGFMRVVESLIFALMLTILVSNVVVSLCGFDNISAQISSWIEGIRGPIMLVGVIIAYLDAFLFRSGRVDC